MNLLRHAPAAPERCEFSSSSSVLGRPDQIAANLQRAKHPGLEGVVGRLEGQHQHGLFVLPWNIGERLARFEQPAVGGIEPSLGDVAHRFGARIELPEAHAGRGAECRLLAQPHPRFGDDAEDAFGADEHTVRAWAGAGARQAAGLERADRCHDPRALDEIVDVGLKRRVVAARSRRDPAAERRAAEACM